MVHQRMLVRVTWRAAAGARFGTGLGGSDLSLYMTARPAMRIKRTYDEIAGISAGRLPAWSTASSLRQA
jgi:hypothetical protein